MVKNVGGPCFHCFPVVSEAVGPSGEEDPRAAKAALDCCFQAAGRMNCALHTGDVDSGNFEGAVRRDGCCREDRRGEEDDLRGVPTGLPLALRLCGEEEPATQTEVCDLVEDWSKPLVTPVV